MLKFVGAILLIAAGALAGYMESRKLSMRVKRLEAFFRFLSAAKTEIRYAALPLEDVLKRHGGEVFCFPRESEGTEEWVDGWKKSAAQGKYQDGFAEKDREMLKNFCAGFGSSDTQGQTAHLELYENLAASALEEAERERAAKSKLYRMLGIFGGAAAAILLC